MCFLKALRISRQIKLDTEAFLTFPRMTVGHINKCVFFVNFCYLKFSISFTAIIFVIPRRPRTLFSIQGQG